MYYEEKQNVNDALNTFFNEIFPEMLQNLIDNISNRDQADLMVKQIGTEMPNESKITVSMKNALLARVELLIEDCDNDEARKEYLQTVYNKILGQDQLTIDSILLGFWVGNHC